MLRCNLIRRYFSSYPEVVKDLIVPETSDKHTFHSFDPKPIAIPTDEKNVIAIPYNASSNIVILLNDISGKLTTLQNSHQTLMISHQTLKTSHQNLMTSHQNLKTSHQNLNNSYQNLKTSHQNLLNDFALSKPFAVANSALVATQVIRDLEGLVLNEFFANDFYFFRFLKPNVRSSLLAVRAEAMRMKSKTNLSREEQSFVNAWGKLEAKYGDDSIQSLSSLNAQRHSLMGHSNWSSTDGKTLISAFNANLIVNNDKVITGKILNFLASIITKFHK